MGETLQLASQATAQSNPQLSRKLQFFALDVMKMQGVLVKLVPLIGATMSDLNLVELVHRVTQKLQAGNSGVNPADIITPEERQAVAKLREILGEMKPKLNAPGAPWRIEPLQFKATLMYIEKPFGKVLATSAGKALYTCTSNIGDPERWTQFKAASVPSVEGLDVLDDEVRFNGFKVYTYNRDEPGEVGAHGLNDGGIWGAVISK